MNKTQAIARAKEVHQVEPMLGEEARDATRRWVEMIDDPTQPGPVRDVLCWVVEFGGDEGATVDVTLEDASGKILRKEGYS